MIQPIQFEYIYSLDNNILLIINFLVLIIVLQLCNRLQLFSELNTELFKVKFYDNTTYSQMVQQENYVYMYNVYTYVYLYLSIYLSMKRERGKARE